MIAAIIDPSQMTKPSLAMLELLVVTLLSLNLCSASDQPIVNIKSGTVRGRRLQTLSQEVDVFLSIPYAKPPVGELRFRAPEPADPWTETLDATEFRASCIQKHDRDNVGPLPQREDCLILNVWVPHPCPQSAAVMVWIHGGGFTWGRSENPKFNGSVIAATQKVIVVSMNYRLGVFGFLALDTPDAPGNMGLLDQQLAMKWVHENIYVFGGDPGKVTIFGQSAGGASVGYHLFSAESQKLYQRAIIQSGYIMNTKRAFTSKKEGMERGFDLARQVGCLDDSDGGIPNVSRILKCLKAKPAEDIARVQKPFTLFRTPFPPVIDGTFITEPPVVLARKKEFKKTNLLMGTTKQDSGEMTYRVKLPGVLPENDFEMDYVVFQNVVQYLYSAYEDPLSIAEHYVKLSAPRDGSHFRDILIHMATDQSYRCPSLHLASVYTNAGLDVYYYEFGHRPSFSRLPEWMGSVHSDDTKFVFGQALVWDGFTEEEKQLSRKIMNFWANFAKTGNPNKGHENEIDDNKWTAYGQNKEYFVLNGKTADNPLMLKGLRTHYCKIWKPLNAVQLNEEDTGISNMITKDEL